MLRPAARLLTSAAAALSFSAPAHAQQSEPEAARAADTLVITASRTPRALTELGSAVTILDSQELTDRQPILVSDALRAVPGLAVNRTGQVGALTQVRIRGAEGNHTLVFIDGVEANDPFFSEFNFAHLVAADVERIEVIRGAQSALFGSDAIGGVISIITREPEPGLQADAEAEGGSFGTWRAYGGLGGGSERFRLRGSVSYLDTNGISQAPGGREDDGYDNLTAHLKAIFEPTPDTRIEGVLRHVDSRVETDEQDFDPTSPTQGLVVDVPLSTDAKTWLAKLSASASLAEGALLPYAWVAYTDAESDNRREGELTGANRGSRLDSGAQLTGRLTTGPADHALTLVVEVEEQEFENIAPGFPAANQQRSETQTSLVAEYSLDLSDALFLSGAVRRDWNERFADVTTFRISGAYLVAASGTRLHASFGEGIKDPTFFELFGFDPGSFAGNPDLQPERSEGWDVGLEQRFAGGRVSLDVTYFNSDLEDEITTLFLPPDFVAQPVNQAGTSEREGVEVQLAARPLPDLRIDASYTWLDATDPDGEIEVRRPEHSASLNVTLDLLDDRATLNLGVDYNGEQEDLEFIFATPEERVVLEDYTLVRIAGAFDLTPNLALFGRVENLADEDYREVFGFASTGLAAYGGLRARF